MVRRRDRGQRARRGSGVTATARGTDRGARRRLGPDGDTVELHDIVRAHLRSSVQDRLADLHVALLDRFAAELPPSTSLSSDPNLIGVAWWCLADDLTFMRDNLAADIAESHHGTASESDHVLGREMPAQGLSYKFWHGTGVEASAGTVPLSVVTATRARRSPITATSTPARRTPATAASFKDPACGPAPPGRLCRLNCPPMREQHHRQARIVPGTADRCTLPTGHASGWPPLRRRGKPAQTEGVAGGIGVDLGT
jgi:hypothetical protein